MKIVIISVVIILIVVSLYFLIRDENFGFTSGPGEGPVVIYDNTEFRGINLLGISSEDGVVHTQNMEECSQMCADSIECQGFSYFKPNGDCYLFGSGDVIPNDQGFAAGKKV